MKKNILITLLLLISFIITGCGESEIIPVVEKENIQLFTKDVIFSAKGETKQLKFASEKDWNLSLKGDDVSWCSLSVSSGIAGDVIVDITALKNDNDNERKLEVVIDSQEETKSIIVSQVSKIFEYSLSVDKHSFNCTCEEQEINISVSSNVTPDISVNESWISVINSKSVTTKVYKFKLSKNSTFVKREAEITFVVGDKKEKIVVNQSISDVVDDYLTTDKTTYDISADGGNITMNLESNKTINLTIDDSSSSWIKNISSKKSSFDFEIFSNSNTVKRVGRLTFIAGSEKLQITINQEGKNVVVTNIITDEEAKAWGLGDIVSEQYHRDRNYDWYYDQDYSGTYYYANCGPTCAVMAVKWCKKSFSETPEQARNKYFEYTGANGWTTDQIPAYIKKNGGFTKTISIYDSFDVVKDELKKGNIAIFCVDIFFIKYNKNKEERVKAYYETTYQGSGHYILIKGYVKVGGKEYFEVYDPNGQLGMKYKDGSLCGTNRYYSYEDMKWAVRYWHHNAIIVSDKSI
ncbi:MAG: C39 family peptidase [Bacteroidetes bacterium]|nr:C39 family peptidase [Bacteroidota bacterium]